MNNVLITSAGRRGELLRIFSAELKKKDPRARILATDVDPGLSAACQIADLAVSVPRVNEDNYVEVLLDLCRNHKVGMLVPTIDPELEILAEHRSLFLDHGVQAIVSDYEFVKICRDKRILAEKLRDLELNTPEIYPRDQIQFPCFAKPFDGSGSVGVMAVSSEDELPEALINDKKMMFMELIDSGHEEYTIDAYYDKCGVMKCLVPRLRIDTRGGEVSKGVTRMNELYEYLRPRIESVAGARGCLTFQVFANTKENRYYAIEINPRFGGGFPLTYCAGANYVAWLLDEYFYDRDIDFYDNWERDLLMLRYDTHVLRHDYR